MICARPTGCCMPAGIMMPARPTWRWPTERRAWRRCGRAWGLCRWRCGESQVADHAFVRALAVGARAPEAALIRVGVQGQLAARAGHADLAGQFWSQIDPRSALPYRLVLEAELALAQADYAGAERGYRVALAGGLAAEWHALAHMRLALLRASSDPPGALAELALAAAAIPLDNDWLAPLLPSTPDAQQLAGVLRAPPDQRAQLLGQIYLGARL